MYEKPNGKMMCYKRRRYKYYGNQVRDQGFFDEKKNKQKGHTPFVKLWQ